MFRIKQNIYATQFHPEGDPEGFILRVHVYKNHGYFAPEEAELLIQDLADKQTPHAQLILKRFVTRYRHD
jgi:GMP synthase (glutamine-hydrolysing)